MGLLVCCAEVVSGIGWCIASLASFQSLLRSSTPCSKQPRTSEIWARTSKDDWTNPPSESTFVVLGFHLGFTKRSKEFLILPLDWTKVALSHRTGEAYSSPISRRWRPTASAARPMTPSACRSRSCRCVR